MSYIIMTAFTLTLFISQREQTAKLINSFFSSVFSKSEKGAGFSLIKMIFASSATISAVSLTAWISSQIFSENQVQAENINIIYLIIVSVIIVPFAEEFFFRGILLGWLLNINIKKPFAVIASAIVFAIFHSPKAMPYAFTGGLLISAFTVMSGSFRVGVILHFINNLHAFADVFLPDEIMLFANIAIVMTAAVSGVMLLVQKGKQNHD